MDMPSHPEIENHLTTREGFCHPNWQAISAYIENKVPESEQKAAREWATRQWLDRLRREFGGNYVIGETHNFLILAETVNQISSESCKFYETALKQILATLKGAASNQSSGRHAVIIFSSLDAYYGYITYFYPEGNYPMTGGICFRDNSSIHFAFPTTNHFAERKTFVHELTHGCLAHLNLPTWLDEALAMRMEEVVCGSRMFVFDDNMLERHVAHWNHDSIQGFWMGASWNMPGDDFELSYDLAQLLWREIEVGFGASIKVLIAFIVTADAGDGGEAACRRLFGASLDDVIAGILGPGDWKPDPKKWPTPQ